jgi:hypothetical protein
MSSRSDNLVRRVPAVVGETLRPHRPRKPSERNAPVWPATHCTAGSAPTAAHRQLDADAPPAAEWREADLSDALEPFGLPAGPRVADSHNRGRLARIATWETVAYACRLISVSLVVVLAHLAVLRWIFLPIGG